MSTRYGNRPPDQLLMLLVEQMCALFEDISHDDMQMSKSRK